MSHKSTPATLHALACALIAAVLFQNAHEIVEQRGFLGPAPDLIPRSPVEFAWLLHWWPYVALLAIGLPVALAKRSIAAVLTVQLLGIAHGFFQVLREIASSPEGLRLGYPVSLAVLFGWLCCTVLSSVLALTPRKERGVTGAQ